MNTIYAAIERWFHEDSLPWIGRCRGEGQFGARPEWWCEGIVGRRSGLQIERAHPIWEEPERVCTYGGSLEEPAEYELVCPDCGSHDVYSYGENNPSYKVTNRRRVPAPYRPTGHKGVTC